MPHMGEHSPRGAEVTEQVAVWIENDGELLPTARYKLGLYDVKPGNGFVRWMEQTLRNAREHTAPWQVAQDLSPNDYDRIDWVMVADRVRDHDN